MKILIVEDNELGRLTMTRPLQEAGFEVVAASDGREALNLLHSEPIRLVVADHNMPKIGGIELCRAIRSAGFRHYIYFILVTNHSRPQDTAEGLEAGADDFIAKPLDPIELILRVKLGQRTVVLDNRDLSIFAMSKLAESRDSETGMHLERISSYCHVLARWIRDQPREGYEIDDEFVQLIEKTSPMHDIGKIAIPDCILLKPGKLDADEFESIKLHTMLGARMIDAALREFPNARFLSMARDIALSHHERYDGGGYPQGLAGKAIPLSGRIVALADVYDALTTKRIYKIAFTHKTAATIITEKSQGQFDPLVIEAFLAEERKFTAIHAEFLEEEQAQPFKNLAAVFAIPTDMELTYDNTTVPGVDR
jgi:putative two-component system response regulator